MDVVARGSFAVGRSVWRKFDSRFVGMRLKDARSCAIALTLAV